MFADAPTRRSSRWIAALTTPLLPEDFLGLVDPLWSTTQLRARVIARRAETTRVTTLTLRPGRGWTGHRAGQYVQAGVDVDGVRHWRSYSLACAETDGDLRITVTAQPGGLVSSQLAQHTPVGTVLQWTAAAGDFTLPDPVPQRLLMITAGSGITPVMGMLRTLDARGELPDVVLVHSARDAADVIFGAELRALAARHRGLTLHLRHTAVEGRLDPDAITALVPDADRRAVYVCGPDGLLDAAAARWGGRARYERFTPPTRSAGGRGGTVGYGDRAVDVDGATSLLDAGEAAGVLMPSGCRMGICFGCVLPLRDGQVRDLRTGAVHGEPGDLVQTCISGASEHCRLDVPR